MLDVGGVGLLGGGGARAVAAAALAPVAAAVVEESPLLLGANDLGALVEFDVVPRQLGDAGRK